jgi:hypothetical protein
MAAVSERVRRAQQLRKRRGGGVNGQNDIMEMSLLGTVTCIFVLLCIGASVATTYLVLHNPGCMDLSGSASSESVAATPNVRTPAAAAVPVVPPPAPAPKAAAAVVPPPAPAPKAPAPGACTPDQLGTLLKQLPISGCLDQGYLQGCSLTKATRMSCRSNDWMRDSYATQRMDDGFTGVFIGCTAGDASIMDSLAIGSHDTKTFSTAEWIAKSGVTETCPFKDVTFTGDVNPMRRVICVQTDEDAASPLTTIKTALGLAFELQVTIADAGLGLDTVWAGLPKKVIGSPIRYLKISKGSEYDTIANSPGVMARVQYLEFGYHWSGPWKDHNLKDLIDDQLQTFVCYWHGENGNLWRISDCWQDHYANKQWANIACVSTVHADAKDIHTKMEAAFLATLAKPHTFE